MAGPMVEVDTQIAAVNLDIARQLYMGDDCRLRLIIPDQTQTGGYQVIAEYTEAFDEIDEAEREVADGSTIVFDIADIFDPPGELRTKLDEAGFAVRRIPSQMLVVPSRVRRRPRFVGFRVKLLAG
jgi:hypothetical protein